MSLIDRLYGRISRPVPARPVGFVRIVIGAAAILRAFEGLNILWPLTKPQTLRLPYADWLPDPTEAVVVVSAAVWLLAAVAFTVGWKTRVAGFVLFGTIGLVLTLDQQAYSNHLYLMALLVLLLTVGDAGAGLSLDARGNRRDFVPAGPVMLMKLQISIVYGFAALTKVNAGFLGGGVLAAQLGTGFLPVPAQVRVPIVMMGLAAAVVALEAFLAFGLWLPRYRPAALVLGLAFHISIVLLMAPVVQLVVFAMEMLAAYLLFLELTPGSRSLVFDDSCAYCTGIVHRIRQIDWLEVHRFVGASAAAEHSELSITDEEAQTAVQLVYESERRAGFEALGMAAESLPVSYLVAPVHRLLRRPGARWYRAAASRRNCRRTELPIGSG